METEEEVTTLSYDELVVALGAISRTLPIPGLADHALGFKSLADAIHLRNHILRRLEAATAASIDDQRRRELTFVFVGAGYAGVEALAELSDLVRDAMRYYPTLRDTPQHWVLVDAADKILPEIPPKLGDYAAQQLSRRGVDIRVRTTLESVEPHAAILSDGSRIPASTVVWTAGVRANPLNERLGMPLDDRGRVLVGPTLAVEGVPHVWALGDGARVPNEATPGSFDPPTCQHALRQARRLAKNLTGERKPYRYRMLGQVATLGRYKGIADVVGLRFRGFAGWFVTPVVPPVPAPAADPKAARRRRLDDVTLLQARHRRAEHARPPRSPRPLGRLKTQVTLSSVQVAMLTADLGGMRPIPRDRVVQDLALLGAGALLPGAALTFFAHHSHNLGTNMHFIGVGVSAVMASVAALALTVVGVRRQDGRVVLVGSAFTVMAALLAIHGLATPGVIIGNNGVISLTGAATLPVGGSSPRALRAARACVALRASAHSSSSRFWHSSPSSGSASSAWPCQASSRQSPQPASPRGDRRSRSSARSSTRCSSCAR